MVRYANANPATRQMLISIEADHASAAQSYLEHFGLSELPIPIRSDYDERQYRTWQLQPVFVDGKLTKYDYVKSHVPADKGGYIQAMTGMERFDQERPTDEFDTEGVLIEPKSKSGRGSSD